MSVPERQYLHRGFLVQIRLRTRFLYDVQYFRVEHDAYLLAASLSRRARCIGAPRLSTVPVNGRKCSTVECHSKNDLVWVDIISPQEIHTFFYFRQVGVRIEIWADPFVALIPSTVKIVRHPIMLFLVN